MKSIFLPLFTILFTFVSVANADLKYSFVDLDYVYTDYDSDQVEGGNGVRLGVSVSPMEHFFVTGGYVGSKADGSISDWDVETTQLKLGLGGYVDLVDSFHLVGEAGLLYTNTDTNLKSLQKDELGVYAKPGVRLLLVQVLELNANMIFTSVENEEFAFGLGAGFNLFEHFQIKAGMEFSENANLYGAGLRLQW